MAMLSEPLSTEEMDESRKLLYEAYGELQCLVTELGDVAVLTPVMVVVGHKKDGKSALVEALMEFQFNHVGENTKMCRPIALRFNPHCHAPNCRLLTGLGDGDTDDDARAADHTMSLADI